MEFLQNLLFAIIAAAVPVITTFVCKFLQSVYENNKNKIKNDNVQAVLGQITDMIAAAVETTTNTYVDNLKADNLFDEKAQKEAFKKTFDAVQKQITDDAYGIIEDTYGDVNEYLINKIEQLVAQSKNK